MYDGLAEEQLMLRDTLARFLREKYDFQTRREIVASAEGWRRDYWQAFANELGILGAPFPEQLGGLGGGQADVMIIMEEFGKALVLEPFLATVVIAGGLLQMSGHADAAARIGDIIEGRTVYAFAYGEPSGRYDLRDVRTTARKSGSGWILNGQKSVVVGAPWADWLIVSARTGGSARDSEGISLFLVPKDAAGVERRDYATIDGARASDVRFDAVALPADALLGGEGAATPMIEHVLHNATAAICAEALGILRTMHDNSVDYTKQRKQFGQPIGKFQVLQHKMVDMYMRVEEVASMTAFLTASLSQDAFERARAVSAAKVQIGRACKFVGHAAIQLHGGIGTTDELAVGHYFKRAVVIEGLFGSTNHHLRRFEELVNDEAA